MLDWLHRNSDLLSLALGILGFIFLVMQIRKAKGAAEAAQHATGNALQAVSRSLSIADISTIVSGLREAQVALRGSRFEAALIRLQALRSQLHSLRARADFASDDRRREIQEAVVILKKLQDRLEKKLEEQTTALSVSEVNIALADLSGRLDEWSEELRLKHGD